LEKAAKNKQHAREVAANNINQQAETDFTNAPLASRAHHNTQV
jgi:hypothetical protein